MSSALLLTGKRNPNGFSSDLGSKHPTDSSSVLSDKTLQLDGKSFLISGFWTPAGEGSPCVSQIICLGYMVMKSPFLKSLFVNTPRPFPGESARKQSLLDIEFIFIRI